jgi:ribosome-associated translation inhibitor RaiA
MADTQILQVQTYTRGAVPEDAIDLAVQKVRGALRLASEPVLYARVKLTRAADPAVDTPAVAQANVDVNGRQVRAQAVAATMREAIDLMCDKLVVNLGRVARNWSRFHRGHAGRGHEPGQWRHGSPSARRPSYFPRPADERGVVRHKSYGLSRFTPDEAAADMELLDYDFHLFTERSTNQDSVVYRAGHGYRIAQAHPESGRPVLSNDATTGSGVTGSGITVSTAPAPRLDLGEAEQRLEAFGWPFLFFVNAATGRGNLVYHRYDGDYGLITPADGSLASPVPPCSAQPVRTRRGAAGAFRVVSSQHQRPRDGRVH